MMRTVRHEGFHQYLDRLLPDPPVWFNEGMATYFEGMERSSSGEMKIGRPRRDDLALLAEKGMAPLAQFLAMGPRDFYRTGRIAYAQAWLLVHMMKHGTPKQRDLYKNLMARLETSSATESVAAVFTEDVMRTLDQELESYRLSFAKGN